MAAAPGTSPISWPAAFRLSFAADMRASSWTVICSVCVPTASTTIGRDDLARDYAHGAFLLFLTAFFAAMVVKQTARGDAMFIQMLGGASRHILDHDALSLLN